jgi:hypothetical protein
MSLCTTRTPGVSRAATSAQLNAAKLSTVPLSQTSGPSQTTQMLSTSIVTSR